MALWMVRAGRNGEHEKLALEHGLAIVGWEEVDDLAPITTRDALGEVLAKAYPDRNPRTVLNWQAQLWALRDTMAIGDLIALPLKSRADIALGRIDGPYEHRALPDGSRVHCRRVTWLQEKPRTAFDSDLLYSLGASQTICRIARNDAEARIAKLAGAPPPASPPPGIAPPPEPPEPPPDIVQQSEDLIRARIAQQFKGHDLALLVAALLEAQGYRTRLSPPGADGGVDIVAGRGPLGFDSPRLIVQVKSQDAPLDVKVVRELKGVMGHFHADHALLVGWGGFNKAARTESAPDYFRLRLWDAGDVLKAVQDHYDHLPEDLRTRLPLQRVWTLVPDAADA